MENLSIQHDGITRVYDLYIPDSAGPGPFALVVDIHGFTVTKSIHRGYSGFQQLAEEKGFAVAWPDGVLTTWNTRIGFDGRDDIGFIRAMVSRINSQHNIDPQRIYASGQSMGGGMVYRLACEAADLFAAFAPVAMTIHAEDAIACNPARPVPILSFNGLTDIVAPYDGDNARISAPATLEHWQQESSCSGPVVRDEIHQEAWCDTDRHCSEFVEVGLCTVFGNANASGHLIYFNTAGLDIARHAWTFLERFTLAGGTRSFQISAGLNDAWVSDEAPFQGIFITVYESLGKVFLSWFTFDSQAPSVSPVVFGAIDQRWVTGVGVYDGDTAHIEFELTSGGVFNEMEPLASQQGSYGTATLVFKSCNEAMLNYEFPGQALSGELTLSRILTSNLSLCEALSQN